MHKTRKNKITSIVLLLSLAVLLVFAPSCASSMMEVEMDFGDMTSSERLAAYFAELKKNGSITEEYPDYYGGLYYEDNTLCVVVTDRSRKTEKLIREITGSETLKIVYGTASLNELESEIMLISEKFQDIVDSYQSDPESLSPDLLYLYENGFSCGLSEKDNMIIVSFPALAEDYPNLFKEYISSYDNIVFSACYPE